MTGVHRLLLLLYPLKPGSFIFGDKSVHIFSLATVCPQCLPFSVGSGYFSWSIQLELLLDTRLPWIDNRPDSKPRNAQNIGRVWIFVLGWNALLYRNFKYLKIENIFFFMKRSVVLSVKLSMGTYFKVTSKFPHSYGTDGNGSGFRVLTTPLKMF